MDLSIFWARYLGILFLIMSLSVFFHHRKRLSDILRTIYDYPLFILVFGVINVLLGLAVVITHNIWISNWPVLITILGWLMLISGISRLIFPEMLTERFQVMKIEKLQMIATVMAVVIFLIGAFLTYKGFVI